MTTPKWQPGRLYAPGALVQPIAGLPATQPAIANPGFETGDATGWTIGANMSINGYGRYAGLWALQLDTGVATGPTGQEAVNNSEVEVNPGQKITARCMIHQGASSTGNAGGWVRVKWYNAAHGFISNSDGNNVKRGDGGAIHPSTVAAVAPAGAAYARIAVALYRVNQNYVTNADEFSWDYSTPVIPAGLIYKAVQPATGYSDTDEPTWPLVLGVTVVDNEVTWEAVQANRVIWEASPIMLSGATEPVWPTQPGGFVADNTISWECISRRVEDPKCPNSKVVAIIAGKVFAADKDIVRFSATANPLDWSSEQDAGYLPTGLQQANANDMAVLAPYRSNLCPMNASSFQNWQVDPDPAAMAILDQMDGIGSVWQQAAVSVGNELFYLTALGVRTVGIAAGAENLAAGDVGAPIDAMVREALAVPGVRPIATYYPGAGQYWLAMRPALPVVEGPTITGAAPDANIGEAYAGFSYTVTPGDAAVGVTTISDGAFPPGMTYANAVIGAAPPIASGGYTFQQEVMDLNGLSATLWDTISVPISWYAVSLDGATEGEGQSSSTGAAWSRPLTPLLGGRHIFSGAGKLIIVTVSWAKMSADAGVTFNNIVGPTDGSAWRRGNYVDGVFYITTNGGGFPSDQLCVRSTDGLNYTTMTLPGNFREVSRFIKFKTLLYGFGTASIGGNYATSSDKGISWDATLGQCFVANTNATYAATDDTSLIAVGVSDKLARTTNGTSWTDLTSPFPGTADILLIHRFNGLWIIVNASGAIASSASGDDGTWTIASYTLTGYPNAMSDDGTRCIIVGEDGTMTTSLNGTTWANVVNSFPNTSNIFGVTPMVMG